jgi:hypothetical protein
VVFAVRIFNGLNRTFLCGNVTWAAYNEKVSSMAKKQAIANETAASASPARAAKPKTPRVKAAKHSKAVSTEPVVSQASPESAREVIAEIAYSFWEARGRQNGAALEDWLRAEQEYRQRLTAARL